MACVLCFLIGRRIVAKCQDCSRLSCQMHPNFGPQLRCFDDYVYTSSFRFLVREKGVNIRYLILANYFNKAILVSYYIQLFRYLSFIYDIFQLLLIININIKQKYKNLFIFIFSAFFCVTWPQKYLKTGRLYLFCLFDIIFETYWYYYYSIKPIGRQIKIMFNLKKCKKDKLIWISHWMW